MRTTRIAARIAARRLRANTGALNLATAVYRQAPPGSLPKSFPQQFALALAKLAGGHSWDKWVELDRAYIQDNRWYGKEGDMKITAYQDFTLRSDDLLHAAAGLVKGSGKLSPSDVLAIVLHKKPELHQAATAWVAEEIAADPKMGVAYWDETARDREFARALGGHPPSYRVDPSAPFEVVAGWGNAHSQGRILARFYLTEK